MGNAGSILSYFRFSTSADYSYWPKEIYVLEPYLAPFGLFIPVVVFWYSIWRNPSVLSALKNGLKSEDEWASEVRTTFAILASSLGLFTSIFGNWMWSSLGTATALVNLIYCKITNWRNLLSLLIGILSLTLVVALNVF